MRTLALLLLLAAPAAAAPQAAVDLAPRYRAWLEEVDVLLQPEERQAFLALSRDYQRDAFVERFWEVRDPFPKTARNELRDRWEERWRLAKERFPDLADARVRVLLVSGEPASVFAESCSDLLSPIEVWAYPPSEAVRHSYSVVFYAPVGGSHGLYRLWHPSDGFGALLNGMTPVTDPEGPEMLRTIASLCPRGSQLLDALAPATDWDFLEKTAHLVPRPAAEWVRTFTAYSTDLPEGAATFPAELTLSYPGRYQSRTVLQGVITVPTAAAGAPGPADAASYNFVADGEVLRQGELFEHFRYRFRLPVAEVAGDRLPLVFERYLRPGAYTLVVKVEDLSSHAFYREERTIEVPPKPLPAVETAATGAAAATAAALGEANASIAAGDHVVRLIPPPPEVLATGKVRVEAEATGVGIERIAFSLDGKPILSKRRPPYSVELDLGAAPRVHRLEAVAEDADGKRLARDEVLINAGPHRFAVRLIEPTAGARYVSSLRVQAVVEVPEGERLDRVELYRNESLVATLYQPPFAQPILLPQSQETTFVRVVAYLVDGGSAEDVAFVNSPDFEEKVKVQLVELYSSVLDRRGRPVDGLAQGDFKVLEDGIEQQIRRFERVVDQPIHAGVVLDTSSSMLEELPEAVNGALAFFDKVLTPRDRAAVITFSDAPHLAVRFTNQRAVLEGGLAGLTADGDSAIYDSLIYALHYFSGIKGKRAIILLSDGDDQGSHWSYDDVIDYARRTGVAIYAVGLDLQLKRSDIRLRLERLASETGGRSFFIEKARELDRVYAAIEEELRTQYLIAYQSSHEGNDDRFRQVELRVLKPGLEAKTIRGYYP